ncbi:unnamed protein product [Rotaria magnacalcarata]|uniref:DDE-1 domain-containing protein n=3 Tax=Rotaria magnacalcarata TaxID=392030 RepID=A0A815R8Z4_9BILA|nr:unnamed protein product [Rotaria magnacalcarata]CAF2094247.1 unnamed protein product [Rotaria magnacalcarata]
MVRHYKRKTISKYSEADIQKALEAVRNENLKPCDVACDRNIPLSTLYARLAGKHGHAKRGDECGFLDDPGRLSVIVKRSTKYPIASHSGTGKNLTTVLVCTSANGKILPPYIIFQGAHLWSSWISKNCFPGTRFNASLYGWVEEHIFFDWLTYHFIPYVKDIPKPVLLILDGHNAHISTRISKIAIEYGIELLCLPPHSTTLLQPLDVVTLTKVKTAWRLLLNRHNIQTNSKPIDKKRFSYLVGELWRNHILSSHCSSGFSRAGIYPFDPRVVTKERMLIPPSSTFSNTSTNSKDDSVLIKHTPRVTRSSSCDTFSTEALNATTTPLQQAPRISSVPEPINYSSGENTQCDISEQLPIYDQGTSSILVPQLPESQNCSSISLVVHNAMQTLYSEQVENLSDVAYDAVSDQCNWNDTGFTLFENNENLYDPLNSSIELVHQQHTPSRLNQSSTTISDLSANIRTDNSRNSSFEVLTNVISSFLTPSFSSPSKKRKFIIERPHGESLTSMDAIYKINQKEKRKLKNKKSTSTASKEATKTRKIPAKRGRKPKTLTKPTFETLDVEEASNDTNANIMPMISCHSNVPYIPPQMPYSTQIPAPYGYNQSLNAFYSYAPSPITCYRCNQEILNGSYTKCTSCIKICCANCSQLFYSVSTSNFTCEQCSLQSYLDLTTKIRN